MATVVEDIRRLRQAPHLSAEQRRMVYTKFQLDLQTGIGTTTGVGVNPVVYLAWSDTGGRTWSNDYPMPVGPLGRRRTRAIWRRLGQARDRIFRVVMSDPVNWVLLDAYVDVTPGTYR